LTPKPCWPTTTPCNPTLGTQHCSHTGQTPATKICSVTCTGTTGTSITSQVRCTHPPPRLLPHSGQASTPCSTRWVGAIRSREKPCSRGFRVSFSSRGRWAEGGLLPGIPGDPRLFRRASKAAIRRCNWAMAALCSTMIASRVSLLAVARSSSVFTLVVYHC
jgi:hypothetical protein